MSKPLRAAQHLQNKSERHATMATTTNYGVQFEALMSEVCRDFGYKLVKSWELDRGTPLDKAEIRDFVGEAVKNFFKSAPEPEAEAEAVVESPPPSPKKKKAPVAKKAKKKAAAEPEPEPEPETPPAKKAPVAKKGKAGAKPKCQAVTAKGTPCSKCAVENSPFCSIHDPTKAAGKAAETSSAAAKRASASAGKKPAAKGKGLSKKAAEKESSTAPASVKHSHGLDELDYENCDLCKSHGGPFELPEYEAATAPMKKSWADEIDYDPEEDPEEDDPDYVIGGSLSEEDFDEDE